MSISSRHLLALLVSMCCAAWLGYSEGYSSAKLKGDSALAELQAEHANALTKRALAITAVEKLNREELEKAYDKAFVAESNYHAIEQKYNTVQRENATLSRQVADAALLYCSGLPAEWVRQHNIYITGRIERYPHSDQGRQTAHSTKPTQAPQAVAYSVPGIQPGQSPLEPVPLVTPEDLLTYTRDAAAICNSNANQLNALIDLLGEGHAGE